MSASAEAYIDVNTRRRDSRIAVTNGSSSSSKLRNRKANVLKNASTRLTPTPSGNRRSSKLVTSNHSKFLRVDLEALIRDDEVWDSLREDQQARLIARMGLTGKITQKENGKYVNAMTIADPAYFNIAKAVERFEKHLKAGHLDPEWIARATDASERRARGEFANFEEGKGREEVVEDESKGKETC